MQACGAFQKYEVTFTQAKRPPHTREFTKVLVLTHLRAADSPEASCVSHGPLVLHWWRAFSSPLRRHRSNLVARQRADAAGGGDEPAVGGLQSVGAPLGQRPQHRLVQPIPPFAEMNMFLNMFWFPLVGVKRNSSLLETFLVFPGGQPLE